MTHPILAAIDDLDTKIGNSADLKAGDAAELGVMLDRMRNYAREALNPPVPGSTMGLAGATVTHRPDVVYNEAQRQAAMQGDADRSGGYLPSLRAMQDASAERVKDETRANWRAITGASAGAALAQEAALGQSTHHIHAGGTIQEQAKPHPAEHAVIGGERR